MVIDIKMYSQRMFLDGDLDDVLIEATPQQASLIVTVGVKL